MLGQQFKFYIEPERLQKAFLKKTMTETKPTGSLSWSLCSHCLSCVTLSKSGAALQVNLSIKKGCENANAALARPRPSAHLSRL
jgi:hypothetical protein